MDDPASQVHEHTSQMDDSASEADSPPFNQDDPAYNVDEHTSQTDDSASEEFIDAQNFELDLQNEISHVSGFLHNLSAFYLFCIRKPIADPTIGFVYQQLSWPTRASSHGLYKHTNYLFLVFLMCFSTILTSL